MFRIFPISAGSRPRAKTMPGSLRILFSGSLIERKGVDLLGGGLCCAGPRKSHGVRLTLAGVGPLQESMETDLVGLPRSGGLSAGLCLGTDLPSVYAQADVLCVPSRYDGWAMVVPEGLAAGLPVITTDQTGAAHDLIKTGDNGWVVPAGDDGTALLQCLRQAAALSTDQRAIMSRAAVASVAQHQLSDGVTRFLQAAEASLTA